jgi:ammonium transporter
VRAELRNETQEWRVGDQPIVPSETDPLKRYITALFAILAVWACVTHAGYADEPASPIEKAQKAANDALVQGDSAWMLVSSALVLLMVPGLALFYGGMVRRKNVLATMMQSMVCLAIIGVYWVAVGYALAFGNPWITLGEGKSLLGFSSELLFLRGVKPEHTLPHTNIPVYLHVMFQGMFAIITPALISGAVAERIRFKPYCIFLLLWVTFVYCPLAHMVWALDWHWTELLQVGATLPAKAGETNVGLLGGYLGALDFAGGTVVHISAGLSSLAAILVLRRRHGYPEQVFHPNSMVLTLAGAGLLWFGWFGFNGGSALTSGPLAVVAFSASQVAAAAAGLSWMLVEWLHRGKPTALGLASGIVAGLVAVTPASGFVLPWGGLVIGLIAGAVCYGSVFAKSILKYDDSLDAFGVHGVGGFLGAVLTGVFCVKMSEDINPTSVNGLVYGNPQQVLVQLVAAAGSAVLAFTASLILVKAIDLAIGFVSSDAEETDGLDRTEHGEVGFDLGLAMESVSAHASAEPRAAVVPPIGKGRFQVIVEGANNGDLIHTWSEMCQPGDGCPPEFKAVYPYVTTVQGNRFQFRGGDRDTMRDTLQKLFSQRLGRPVRTRIEA